MKVFKLIDDHGITDSVRVDDTHTGQGVFAVRAYPANAVIGEITGEIIFDAHYGSDYSFELGDNLQLEPFAPFRYLNHSCDPNCEFDWLDQVDERGQKSRRVYVAAIRTIKKDEQLTIDYNWPARWAIRCDCRSPLCRGWVVSAEELGLVASRNSLETWPDLKWLDFPD